MSVRVIQSTNLTGLRKLAERISSGTHPVMVGVPSGAVEADGTSLPLVAATNEFGTEDGRIPERPAFRRGLGSHESQRFFSALNARNLAMVAEGRMTEIAALEQLGLAGVSRVQHEMLHGDFVPNAPSTVQAKGSDKPLIDTTQLLHSVTHVVAHGEIEGVK